MARNFSLGWSQDEIMTHTEAAISRYLKGHCSMAVFIIIQGGLTIVKLSPFQ